MSSVKSISGVVGRVACRDLAYVLDKAGVEYVVTPSHFDPPGDGSVSQLPVHVGDMVDLSVDSESNSTVSAKINSAAIRDPDRAASTPRAADSQIPKSAGASHFELRPDNEPRSFMIPRRAVTPGARAFGKLLEVVDLQPGDLLLTREMKPDRVSRQITEVQMAAGYSEMDAMWTHAAMYVGDGECVLEATFDSPFEGCVKLTTLDYYAQGKHALRFRRPCKLAADRDRWRLCVRGMSKLGNSYSFVEALRLWWMVRMEGRAIRNIPSFVQQSGATVCSTLYADSYAEATGMRLGEVMGACVPAWLSLSDHFNDVSASWVKIASDASLR